MYPKSSNQIHLTMIGSISHNILNYAYFQKPTELRSGGLSDPFETGVSSPEQYKYFIETTSDKIEHLPNKIIEEIRFTTYFRGETISEVKQNIKIYIIDKLEKYFTQEDLIWE